MSARHVADAGAFDHLRDRQSPSGTPVVDWLLETEQFAQRLSPQSIRRLRALEPRLQAYTLRAIVARLRRRVKVYAVLDLSRAL